MEKLKMKSAEITTKLGVTVQICGQIGPDDYKMFNHTKVFEKSATIEEIESWIRKYDHKGTLNNATISDVEE